MVQEAYNEFKRDVNQSSRQMTLFYYKFRKYEIKPGQPDRNHHAGEGRRYRRYRPNY
jgi:hypothetical protein